jgi:hypothetical protein
MLIECSVASLALYLEPGATPDTFNVAATVGNVTAGPAAVRSANRLALELQRWYVASLVYDLDTLALLIDDSVIAIRAFPDGALQSGPGDVLVCGASVDGRWPLRGEVAGVQLWKDIPEALEALLDAERGSPEWHLTWKENEVQPRHNLGAKMGDFYFDPALRS